MTGAPAPLNLTAMADTWDNPIAVAAQLNAYYAQLEREGYSFQDDVTSPRRGAR